MRAPQQEIARVGAAVSCALQTQLEGAPCMEIEVAYAVAADKHDANDLFVKYSLT